MIYVFFLLIQSVSLVSSFGNGVNFQPSYYNNGNVTFGFGLMKKYSQIQSIRIEIEPDKVTQAFQWIQEAYNAGYKDIIATYHTAPLGEDDPCQLVEAAQWWISNYMYLKGAGDFIVNIRNEWGSHSISAENFAGAYNTAIEMIRTVVPSHVPLIVDIPGWGQETYTASLASPLITDKHVVFSAHIYGGAYNGAYNRTVIPSDMESLYATGRDCIIGEYGMTSGDADVIAIVQHAQDIGFKAVYAWAWNGDGAADGKSLNMVLPNWIDDPLSTKYSESSYFYEVIDLL